MRAIAVKEFRELRRDRRTLAMLFLLPFLFLVVFGYAASFDIKDVPTVVVGAGAPPRRRRSCPSTFDVVAHGRRRRRRRGAGRSCAAARRSSPSSRPAAGGGSGDRAHRRHRALRRAGGAAQPRGAARRRTRAARLRRAEPARRRPPPQRVQVDVLFNPDLRTAVIMIPGLCGIILVFVGTVATALGVVRERQSGTMEQLAVMPFRPRDVFLGKIAPYLLIAAVDMVVVVVAGMLLFDVPFRGSVPTFALGALLFLFVTLGHRRPHLERVADPGAGHPAGDDDDAAAVPAERPLLPAVLDAVGGALDRLPAAADLVHQGRARGDGARRADRRALAAARDAGGDGRRSCSPPRPCGSAATSRRPGARGTTQATRRARRAGEPTAGAARERGGAQTPPGACATSPCATARRTALDGVTLEVPAGAVTAVDRRRRRRQDDAAARAGRRGQAGAAAACGGRERRRVGYVAGASACTTTSASTRTSPSSPPPTASPAAERDARDDAPAGADRPRPAPARGSPAGSRAACARSWPSRSPCCTSPTCSSSTSPPPASTR